MIALADNGVQNERKGVWTYKKKHAKTRFCTSSILVEYMAIAYLGAEKGGFVFPEEWFPLEEEPDDPKDPRRAFTRAQVAHGLTMVR